MDLKTIFVKRNFKNNIMTQYLATIEFRYNKKDSDGEKSFTTKTSTIGVFNDVNEAIFKGNELLKALELKYPIIRSTAMERFSLRGFLGRRNFLVTNLGYLKTPFEFYAKITPLDMNPIEITIENITKELY